MLSPAQHSLTSAESRPEAPFILNNSAMRVVEVFIYNVSVCIYYIMYSMSFIAWNVLKLDCFRRLLHYIFPFPIFSFPAIDTFITHTHTHTLTHTHVATFDWFLSLREEPSVVLLETINRPLVILSLDKWINSSVCILSQVIVHHNDEAPPSDAAVNVMPGTEAEIAVIEKQVHKLVTYLYISPPNIILVMPLFIIIMIL